MRRHAHLQREEGGKNVVLSLSANPAVALPSLVPSEGHLKLAANPLKLKRPNPLKQPSATSSVAEQSNEKRKATSLSAAETLVLEEQERKRRRMGHDA